MYNINRNKLVVSQILFQGVLTMTIDGRELGMSEEECENVKKVVSKYGEQVVCSEEDEKEDGIDMSFLGEDGCENVKKTVSKYGVAVVCDEEE